MGRTCTELWTNVHYVLKLIVFILMVIVEFLVLGWSAKRYSQHIYLEGHYFSALSYLAIILYGYTWFDSTIILEICIVIATICMLLFSTVVFVYKNYDNTFKNEIYDVLVHRYDRNQFTIFVALTIVGLIILVVDLILLLLKATGKRAGGSRNTANTTNTRNTRAQQPQRERRVEEDE